MQFTTEEIAAKLVEKTCGGTRFLMGLYSELVGDITDTQQKQDLTKVKENAVVAAAKLELLFRSLKTFQIQPNTYLDSVVSDLNDIRGQVSELEIISPELYKPQLEKLAEKANQCMARLGQLHNDAKAKLHGQAGVTVATPRQKRLFSVGDTKIEEEFVFLHLTDLHIGAKKTADFWEKIQEKFFEDLDHLESRFELNWDAVLFTGDVAFSGTETH